MSDKRPRLNWFGRSPTPPPQKPDPPWFILKIGGFEIQCSKASAQAIAPALPAILRFGWHWLTPSVITFWLLINGIGAGIKGGLCPQPLLPPTPTIAEDVSPQTEGLER